MQLFIELFFVGCCWRTNCLASYFRLNLINTQLRNLSRYKIHIQRAILNWHALYEEAPAQTHSLDLWPPRPLTSGQNKRVCVGQSQDYPSCLLIKPAARVTHTHLKETLNCTETRSHLWLHQVFKHMNNNFIKSKTLVHIQAWRS